MLVRLSLLASVVLLAACGSVGSVCSGCDDGCEATLTCTDTTTSTTSSAPTCAADPVDGDVTPDCGIWVSATLGDDANPGTQDAPVKTLQRGVDLAGPSGNVYACAETYFEPVEIPAGVSLSGGWFCQDGWRLADKPDQRAAVAPVHDVVPITLTAGDGVSILSDLVARAADAQTAGGSSIALWAGDGSAAEIRRSLLEAGDGAKGTAGEHGGVQPAAAGAAGLPGAGACTATIGLGGLAPVTMCDGVPTSGGVGGDGSDAFAHSGGDGLPALGGGTGGNGEDLSPACMPGLAGSDGPDGVDGAGGLAGGTLTSGAFVGVDGLEGKPGSRAQGGGGGGASFGGPGCGPFPKGGAGGGSGGAGGCGGKAGRGGGGGGASIALASRSANIVLEDVRLVAKKGGVGGNGGAGQAGGAGGLPGDGGSKYAGQPPVHAGCAGGFGGRGGLGGNGGGGAGGPSAGIAHLFGAAPAQKDVTIEIGAGGEGGLGGVPGASLQGATGEAAQVLQLGP